MTFTLIGQLLDAEGLARRIDALGHTRAWRTRPAELRRTQPADVPLNINHVGAAVGRVLDLERTASGLWATAEVTRNLPMLVGRRPVFFSAETTAMREGADHVDVELTGIGIVERSAQTNLQPVTVLHGDVRQRHGWALSPLLRRRLDRAADFRRAVECRSAGALVVHDDGTPSNRSGANVAPDPLRRRDVDLDEPRPVGRLHHSRPYSGIISVT